MDKQALEDVQKFAGRDLKMERRLSVPPIIPPLATAQKLKVCYNIITNNLCIPSNALFLVLVHLSIFFITNKFFYVMLELMHTDHSSCNKVLELLTQGISR